MSQQGPPTAFGAARRWPAGPDTGWRAAAHTRPGAAVGMLAHLLSFVAAYLFLGSWPR